jgi:hypothetical protein
MLHGISQQLVTDILGQPMTVPSSWVKQFKNAEKSWMHYYMEDNAGGDWFSVRA